MENSRREQPVLEGLIDIFMEGLPSMLKHHEGKYVVIGSDHKRTFLDTEQTAFNEGVKLYGLKQFLVRQVSEDYLTSGRNGPPIVITRLLYPEYR